MRISDTWSRKSKGIDLQRHDGQRQLVAGKLDERRAVEARMGTRLRERARQDVGGASGEAHVEAAN